MDSIIRPNLIPRVLLSLVTLGWLGDARAADPQQGKVPALAEAVASNQDMWGELAMR